MERYSIVLRNDKLKQYDTIAICIILMNLVAFLLVFIYSPEKSVRVASAIGAGLVAITMGIHYFLHRIKHNEGKPYIHVAFFFIFLAWLQMEYYLVMAVVMLLQSLYQLAKKQAAINFHEEEIEYTAFPRRTYSWDQLNNVMLKDGILTLDFKNNRIIQSEIINSQWDVNEKEFNEFCRRQLIQ